MKVLVAGGSGFIGRSLVPLLRDRDHDVVVMTRHPRDGDLHGAGPDDGHEVYGDIGDRSSLDVALAGSDVAVYLVHSLDREDFADYDAKGAENFAAAANAAAVQHIVYLGGLGDETDDLSAHLRSRREVERILSAQMPTVALRAGIVVGDGSTAWEVLCQLVEKLPVMITPRWVQTRTQPIALADIVLLLAAAVDRDVPAGHYDVGAPECTSYRRMMETVAAGMHRRLWVFPVPVLSPELSSRWLGLMTDVDLTTARALVDSMINEVVVTERRLEELVGVQPMPFDEAVRIALDDRRRRKDRRSDETAVSRPD